MSKNNITFHIIESKLKSCNETLKLLNWQNYLEAIFTEHKVKVSNELMCFS